MLRVILSYLLGAKAKDGLSSDHSGARVLGEAIRWVKKSLVTCVVLLSSVSC